jgi:hypothetical protein
MILNQKLPADLAQFVRAYPLRHDQAVPKTITYPFEPKSVTYLRAGQFGPFRCRMADTAAGVFCTCRIRPIQSPAAT